MIDDEIKRLKTKRENAVGADHLEKSNRTMTDFLMQKTMLRICTGNRVQFGRHSGQAEI